MAIMTLVALVLGFASLGFGIGSWVGQKQGNDIATKSLWIDRYGICSDHEVSEDPLHGTGTNQFPDT